MYKRQLFCLLLVFVAHLVDAGRGGGGSRGGGWSRSGGGSKSSSGGWASPSRGSSGSPSHGSSGGWSKPAGSSSSGSATHAGSPSHGSTGGWQKPASNPAGTGSAGGFQKPGSTSHGSGSLPSSNIGPGGYPVQRNQPSRLPPYSPNDPRRNSPPPSYNSIYGGTQSWGPPPAYSSRASYYGVPSSNYPRQSGFGYPGGQTYHQSTYQGVNMNPPTSNLNYGYPSGGNWGYQPQKSNSLGVGLGSGLGGFLIGYQANNLIHSISNPYSYGSYGYHSYSRPWSRHNKDNNATSNATKTTEDDVMIPCVSYNTTKDGLSTPVVNPNCTCDPISFKDMEGREATQYRCTRKGEPKEDWNKLYKDKTEYAAAFKEYLPTEEAPKGPQQLKLKALTPDGRREEAYSIIEKLVNMGRWNVIPEIPITDSR